MLRGQAAPLVMSGRGGPLLVIRESEGGKQPPWSVLSEGRVTHQVVEGEVTTGLV